MSDSTLILEDGEVGECARMSLDLLPLRGVLPEETSLASPVRWNPTRSRVRIDAALSASQAATIVGVSAAAARRDCDMRPRNRPSRQHRSRQPQEGNDSGPQPAEVLEKTM